MKRSMSLFLLLGALLLLCFPVQAFANFNEFLTSIKFEAFAVAVFVFMPISIIMGIIYKKVESLYLLFCIFFTCRPLASIHFIHEIGYSGTSRGLQLTFVDVFILIIFSLILLRRETHIKINPNYFILIVLMWSWGAYSAFALEPENMLYGFFEVWQRFWIVLFFWVMSNIITSEKKLEFCILSMSFVGLFVGLNSLYQRYVLKQVICTGGLEHQNATVMFCHIYGTLALSQVLNSNNKYISKIFYLFILLLYFGTVILTLSRAGLVAFISSLGLFSIAIVILKFSFRRLLFICCAFVGLVIFITPAFDTIKERFETAPIESGLTRVWYLRVGMEIIKKNMLTGVGINNIAVKLGFPYSYAENIEPVKYMKDGVEVTHSLRSSESEMKKRFEEEGRIGLGIPESAYLVTWVEEGLIGFTIYIFILFSFYITSIINTLYFRKVNQLYFLSSLALVSALTFVYIQSIIESVIKQRGAMYQLYLSFAIIGFIASERIKHKKNKRLVTNQ